MPSLLASAGGAGLCCLLTSSQRTDLVVKDVPDVVNISVVSPVQAQRLQVRDGEILALQVCRGDWCRIPASWAGCPKRHSGWLLAVVARVSVWGLETVIGRFEHWCERDAPVEVHDASHMRVHRCKVFPMCPALLLVPGLSRGERAGSIWIVVRASAGLVGRGG